MRRVGAVIGYSRMQALQEQAVLPVTFGALDGEARWQEEEDGPEGRTALNSPPPNRPRLPAPPCSRRCAPGSPEVLLREAFVAVRDLRARRRRDRGLAASEAALGLGKLLVVALDQERARHYVEVVRRWIPGNQARLVAQLATSDTPRAHEAVAAFRLQPGALRS